MYHIIGANLYIFQHTNIVVISTRIRMFTLFTMAVEIPFCRLFVRGFRGCLHHKSDKLTNVTKAWIEVTYVIHLQILLLYILEPDIIYSIIWFYYFVATEKNILLYLFGQHVAIECCWLESNFVRCTLELLERIHTKPGKVSWEFDVIRFNFF